MSSKVSVMIIDDVVYDAHLLQVETSQQVDTFYILQLLSGSDGNHGHHGHYGYHVWSRLTYNGCKNDQTVALTSFDTLPEAVEFFLQTFQTKTGVPWKDRALALPDRNTPYYFVDNRLFSDA